MLATGRITIAAAVVFAAHIASAQNVPASNQPTKPYTDPHYGVSFQYPANWTLTIAPAAGSDTPKRWAKVTSNGP